jgi:hypothetical protein
MGAKGCNVTGALGGCLELLKNAILNDPAYKQLKANPTVQYDNNGLRL